MFQRDPGRYRGVATEALDAKVPFQIRLHRLWRAEDCRVEPDS
jgi:hypothetical protein